MKILLLSNAGRGGARYVFDTLSSNLPHEGNLIKVLSPEAYNAALLNQIKSKSITIIEKALTKPKFGIFSSFSNSYSILNDIEEFSPDIVHIHNWFNFLSLKDLKKIVGNYPTVFTLHDQRLLTGGCHVTLGCNNYLDDCTNCPGVYCGKKIVKRSKSKINRIIYSKKETIGFISPSIWMHKKVQKVYKNEDNILYAQIPNPIFTTDLFRPKYKTIVKELNVIFIAANIDEPLKQLNLLILKLENYFKVRKEIICNLTIIGSGRRRDSNIININSTGKLKQQEVMSLLVQSDILIVPSLFENQPGVILEAMQIGTLVAASNVGGIGEMILDGVTGYLLDPIKLDVTSVLDTIINASSEELNNIAVRARTQVSVDHKIDKIIDSHLNFYRKLYLKKKT